MVIQLQPMQIILVLAIFGSVFSFTYDPYNQTFIIPSATQNQIFMFDIQTMQLQLIGGTLNVAGNATNVGLHATFSFPTSVALVYDNKHSKESTGYLVTDYSNNCIRHISTQFPHYVTMVAGNCWTTGISDGIGNVAYFNNPINIVLDETNFRYGVADYTNGCVRLLTLNGANYSQPVNVSTIAGICGSPGITTNSGNPLSVKLSQPFGILFIPNSNVMLISEAQTRRIFQINW